MINYLKIIKTNLTLFSMKAVVNTFTTLYAIIFFRAKMTIPSEKINVFIVVGKKDFILTLLAIISIEKFIQNAKYFLIFDKNPNFINEYLIKKLRIDFEIVNNKLINRISKELSDCPLAKRFYLDSWQGKKFLFPLLFNKTGKALVLDPDTLFVKYPREMLAWLKNGLGHLYLDDCGNYTEVSHLEAESILGFKPIIKNFNSGLLCLDLDLFWKNNNLKEIDKYLKNILYEINDRKTKITYTKNPFEMSEHLMEQTMYWLTFENSESKKLPDSYFVFGKHIYNKQKVGNPVFIHFAGEKNKKSMYRYLYFSLIKIIVDKFKKKNVNENPWYLYSDSYCPRCWHGRS